MLNNFFNFLIIVFLILLISSCSIEKKDITIYYLNYPFCNEAYIKDSTLVINMKQKVNEWVVKQLVGHQKVAIINELKDNLPKKGINQVKFNLSFETGSSVKPYSETWSKQEFLDTLKYLDLNSLVGKSLNILTVELTFKEYIVLEQVFQKQVLELNEYDYNAVSFFVIFKDFLEDCSNQENEKNVLKWIKLMELSMESNEILKLKKIKDLCTS